MCLTTVRTSAFTGSPVVEVVLVAVTAAVVERLALLVVRVEVPLLDVLRTPSVKWRHVTSSNNVTAKLFALFKSLKVVFVSVTAGVSELTADSVSTVEVVPAGLFVARSRSVRKHASVALLGDCWTGSSSVIFAMRWLGSRWLRAWSLDFLSCTASLAVGF